ncbi:MAG: class I SAM-dependent methyltransferase [Anaerolineales bacterium]
MNSIVNLNPLIYHHHHAEKIEDIPFWLDLAKEAGDPILELGCGTGRIISQLAKLGQRVVGLDLSFEMLAFLKGNLPIQELDLVDIFQADLGDFQLGRKFSLIFLACNTLSTLHKETRAKAFLRVKEHLSEGGLFAASVPNPVQLERLPVYGESEIEEIISHPGSGNPLQISSEWERFDRDVVFRWHYDQLLPDGRMERSTIEIKHTLTNLQGYQAELQTARLKLVEIYGDFDKSEYDHDSPYLIVLARKTPGF